MRFRIHDGNNDDYIDIEADTIQGIRDRADEEAEKRNWSIGTLWSENLNGIKTVI